MPSERLQRQIDRLLDAAEQALTAEAWATVIAQCHDVLTLDADNAEARSFLAIAERRQAGAGATAAEGVTGPGPADPPAPVLPESFVGGRYRVLDLLGEGGKKIVYRAHDTLLDRDVAFAVLKTDGLDEAGRERVKREAQALGRLGSHPNIVTVHDLGESDGRPYIVTELLPGGDLVRLIAAAPDHRLPLPRVLELGQGISKALAYAHGKGVIHRDLKPGNVWLSEDGTPKLGDFGLALAGSVPRLTQAGMMVGTALYMAPEQATGGEVTPKSDLYSLGCLLYELTCGRPPFVGDESVAIIGQHLQSTPVSPTWHRPDCPKPLDALILRLLEKDPSKRPASAQVVVEALVGISPSAKRTTSESGQQVTTPSGQSPIYRRIFVGREAELKQLEAAFDAASAGQGGLVMVVGEPGIGKTTLTEQLATYAALRGGRTLVGHCYEEGSLSLPYLPFVEAMRTYVLDRDPGQLRSELGSAAPEVARIVSEVRDRVQIELAASAGDGSEERYRLLQAVCSFLRNAAAAQPLVLVLEDLHDADRGTLDLLQFLARQLAGARLLLVGTYRDVEVDRQHPLSATLAELRRSGSFSRVLLRGLTIDEVQRMIAAIAGQEIQWRLAETVHRQTEGNPLFVQEVVRYLAESGLVERKEGRWQVPSAETLLTSIPEGLRDVIGKRLSRLSADCNRLLSIAAVIGREFELGTLQAVAGLPEDAVLTAVEEATRAAVLQEQRSPGALRYRFTHAFFRQTLYEELFAPRRLRLHQQVARTLEQQYAARPEEHAAELAEHFAQSTDPGDLEKAITYSRRAAEQARAVYAHGEAVRLLEQALQLRDVLDVDDPACRCDLLLDLAELMPMTGAPLRAAEQLAPAAFALAEALQDHVRAFRASNAALEALSTFGAGSVMQRADFRLWQERLIRYAAPGTAEEVQGKHAAATLAQWSGPGGLRQAAALRHEALALAERLGDARALAEVAYAIFDAEAVADQRLAYDLAERLVDARWDGVPLRWVALVVGLGAMTLLNWGARERAEAGHRRLQELAERMQAANVRISVQMIPLQLGVLDGRLEETLAAAETMRRQAEALGMALLGQQFFVVFRNRPLLLLGRYEQAWDEGAALLAATPEGSSVLGLLRAQLQAYTGHLEEARTALATYIERMGRPDHYNATRSLILMLEVAMLLRDVALVEEIMPILDQVAQASTARFATCHARQLGDAAALLGERERAKAYYAQALATASQIRFRPEVALAHLGLAEVLAGGDAAERQQVQPHLAFVLAECEAMGMRPALERARRLQAALAIPAPAARPASRRGKEGGTSADAPAPQAAARVPSLQWPGKGPARSARERSVGQVFISYSSADRPTAFTLADRLQAEGVPVWIDKRDIPSGADWDAAIVEAIKASRMVAVLVSPKAMTSRNVRQELRLALQYDKPVLPLLLQPASFPSEVEYVLAGRQWVEALDRPEDDWFAQVLGAVRRLASPEQG